MAEYASRYWTFRSRTIDAPTNERLLNLSQRMFRRLDHVPARLTAFGFAVVGNFEEAVNCWRRDASLWKYDNEGVILAAAAGAVGVSLGGGSAPGLTPDRAKTFTAGAPPESADASGSTPGATPQLGHLRSVVGLVWRSVVLWMLLLALLWLAHLIG
jgi:adenosylcobinamide-phosphate synthase